MIKIKNLFRTLCAIYVTAAMFLGLAGCSNLFENIEKESSGNDSESGKAYISLSLANNSRTILPSKIDLENESGLIFCLAGKSGSNTNVFGYWEDEDNFKAYDIMMSDVVAIEPGKWTFRLSVLRKDSDDDDDSGKEVLYGELTQTITAGANSLSFGELKIPDSSSTDSSASSSTNILNYDVAGGSISFSLSFPGGEAGSATAALYNLDGEEQELSESNFNFAAGETSGKGSVLYTASKVKSGNYILLVKIYSDEEKEITLASYPELVVVEPGAESKAERSLESLNKFYTVTYVLNDSGTEHSALVSVLAGETSLLWESDALSYIGESNNKDYEYNLAGWSKTKGSDTAEYKPSEKVPIDGDTTFYAVWKLHEYKITYTLRDENASLPENAVTKFTKDDTFELPVPTTTTTNSDGVAMKFVGWYDKEDYAKAEGSYLDSKYSEIEEGTKKDLTLYARWGAEDEVEYQAFYIRHLLNEDNTTIYVKGNMTSSQTQDLGQAIRESGHYLNLDLSQTTIKTLYALGEDAGITGYGVNEKSYYLTGIILPDTVTKIDNFALMNHKNIKSIKIPDGVTSIGNWAFEGCSGLTSITIPENVTSIGKYAFYLCTGLTSIIIPENVTSIGMRAFFGDDETLKSVEFKATSGWTAGYTVNGSTKKAHLDANSLSDTSTAATYLTKTYTDDWTREVDSSSSE